MFLEKPESQEFIEEKSQEKLDFKQREFLCVTFEVLVHYLRYQTDYAQDLVMESLLYGKVTDYFSAKAITQYTEYHWAMLLVHGHKYWQEGFSSEAPDDYIVFKNQVLEKYKLS